MRRAHDESLGSDWPLALAQSTSSTPEIVKELTPAVVEGGSPTFQQDSKTIFADH